MIAAGIYGADVGRPPRPGDGGWTWLVSVRYAGRVLRWGNAASFAVEHDGALLSVFGDSDLSGLSITDAIPLGSSGSPTRSLSFAAFMPAGVDVALNERRGIPFSGSEVEVALVPEGGTLSDRCVVLRGLVSEPTYGTADEAVSFTAREPDARADNLYPPEAARTVVPLDLRGLQYDGVGPADVTWFEPSTIDNADLEKVVEVGRIWPRVFGRPGRVMLASGSYSPRPGTPAYAIAEDYNVGYDSINWEALLVSYEHADTTGDLRVTLIRKDDAYPDGLVRLSVPITTGRDHRGVPFTYVSDTSVLALDPATELPIAGMDPYDLLAMRDWSVAWGVFDTSAVGPRIGTTDDPSALDILLWQVSLSSLQWDVGRCYVAADVLSGLLLAGSIEAETSPLDWLSDHVFGTLPVYLATGPLGMYAAPVPYMLEAAHPVGAITVDESFAFLPPQAVQIEGDAETDVVAVNWCRDSSSGSFYKRAWRRRGDTRAVSAADDAWYADPLPSTDSKRGTMSFDLPYVWDDQTAYRILDWLSWREMRQHRTIAVDVDASVFGWLSVGDVVELTATDLHLDAAVCLVASVTRSTSPLWRLRLMPLDE